MDDDAELEVGLVARPAAEDFGELALDFDAHAEGALDDAAALAVGAVVIDRLVDALVWRWRVISMRPSWEMGRTWVRARSRLRSSFIFWYTAWRSLPDFMSMKSRTISPPMLRRRSWRQISSAASRLTLAMVDSGSLTFLWRPVLTSMATRLRSRPPRCSRRS